MIDRQRVARLSVSSRTESADSEAAARAAFAAVRQALNAHGGYRFFPAEVFSAFDAPTKAAIAAVGGLRAITLFEGSRYHRLTQRFIKAYCKAAPRESLPATSGRDLALPVGDRL